MRPKGQEGVIRGGDLVRGGDKEGEYWNERCLEPNDITFCCLFVSAMEFFVICDLNF